MDIRYYIGFVSEWLGVIAVAWLLSMSARFQHKPIGFRYARRDGLVALGLYVLILVLAFIYYSFNRAVFRDPLFPAPAPVHDLGQALVMALIALAPFAIALGVRQQPIRSTGWNPPLLRPALLLGFAMGLLTIFLRNRVPDVLAGVDTATITALLLAIAVSVAEETVFRGYIQMRLAWWLGPNVGLLVTSALFALWHAVPWVQTQPVQTTLILMGLTFVQGLVLGWIMRKCGHVLAPALYRSVSIWIQYLG